MKEFLSRNDVAFASRLLTDELHRRQVERRGIRNPPLTLIGAEEVVGFDREALRSALARAGLLSVDSRTPPSARAAETARLRAPLSGAVAVANFLDDSVTFLNGRGRGYHSGGRAESTVPVEGHPIAVEPCPLGDTLAVVNYEGGSVTFLSLADGSFARQTPAASTLATGPLPLHAVAHPTLPLLYVSNSESRDISVLDASTIEYAFGSRARSSFPLPGQPGVMAIDRQGEILYVRLREGAVVMLYAESLAPLHGDLDRSTFPTGRGRGIALSADGERVFVPEALGDVEGLGVYRAGTGVPDHPEGQPSPRPCAAVPFAVAAHPRRPIIYLSCFGGQVIELRDATSGEYLLGSAERSSFRVGSGARAMLADGERDVLYVSCFDENNVVMLNATNGRDCSDAPAAGAVEVGPGPRGLALVP